MKFKRDEIGLDQIDREILHVIQDNCKIALSRLGEKVGLSAPSVVERLRRLENEGFVKGYHALLDARRLGIDITAFIGVSVHTQVAIEGFEDRLADVEDILECHHVTGEHSLLLKVKTRNTESLEQLIRIVRGIPGVARTHTSVVLSTPVERSRLGVGQKRAPRRAPFQARGE
jgi:Lrp/AsnC family leucine-responsive transcriptional regulator